MTQTDYEIVQADCCEAAEAAENVALTVTSPPYDGIRDYKGVWSVDLPRLGRGLLNATVEGGIAAVVIQDGTSDGAKSGTSARLVCSWLDSGWRLFETVIWNRPGTPGAWWNNRFRVDHEFIFLFLKGKRPRFFDKAHLAVPAVCAGQMPWGKQSVRATNGELIPSKNIKPVAETKCRGTVWNVGKSSYERNKTKQMHPATFPDSLARDLILCFSKPEDLVFDPFTGSGTTAVMALLEGRRFQGSEISQEYINISNERIRSEVFGK